MRAPAPYSLVRGRSRAGLVGRLSRRFPRAGLDGVLADLDRVAERCPVPGKAAGGGFTWDQPDRDDPTWWPQGIASIRSGDVLFVPRRPAGGVRRWPRRVLGMLPRFFGAHDHDYVLPQLTAFRPPLRSGLRRLRCSFVSVGEVAGRPSLVVGEYRRKAQAPPRLARYPLDPGTGLPAVGGRGRCVPLEVHEAQPRRMQGAAVHGSTWFVTASAGEHAAGDLYVGAPGAWVRHRGVLPSGPEDLAWSLPGEELWCVSEWPGRRWVFPIAAGCWQRPGRAEP
jgi:hypothetical protein